MGDHTMNVRELIELLGEQDPDAEVFMMAQPIWPFECSLAGVTTRAEIERAMRKKADDDAEKHRPRGTAKNDVFPRLRRRRCL
jgi:hypothetical protein